MKLFITTILILFTTSSIFGQIEKDSLFVFTGKRVSIKKVKEFKDKETLIDSIIVNDSLIYIETPNVIQDYKYKAKFKIIEQFKGDLPDKKIEFDLYNHYGKPKLSKSNTFLLFVIKIDGEFQLLKYAHHRVYETDNGKFAIPYDKNEYRNQKGPSLKIKPKKINFKQVPEFRIYKDDSPDWVKRTYPKPYYRIEKNKAIPIFGNYIEDYIKLRLNGTLKDVFEN
ncbi:hypothetical protein [Aequorivita xiaoshiensis]|uniref:Uncharacterized protein n=1 Tax=Aequorivita xiaoshiensis TaxID=2874476 RepID=A0A9X1U6Y6_9FLAO|nr:hypothetical protein [Aequorivita xiaoshiensis]MCG2432103.1 hypothetical protein [Aequorivita xiaoshiensis]